MGNCVAGFKKRTTRISPWKKNKNIVICFIGIDGAGKTTIVKALQGEDLGNALPTIGFSRAEVMLKKHKIIIYDLGGGERIREIWSNYYAEVSGIVYVVDSAASNRIIDNQKLVFSLFHRSDLMYKPILFLLNKKDLPEAVDEMQFSDLFKLHEMAKCNKNDIRVEGICAVKGTGKEMDAVILESMEWLIERIIANYEKIDQGINAALQLLHERQTQDRLERQHRLAMLNYENEKRSKEAKEAMEAKKTNDVSNINNYSASETIEPQSQQNNDNVEQEFKNVACTTSSKEYQTFFYPYYP